MKISGVFLCLLFALPVFAECGKPEGVLLSVKHVADGDTLKLADGRSVRVLGINAPELARGNKPAQPYGQASRSAAQQFVRQADGRVRLGFERERTDHYGRLLAHVYDAKGRSLGAAMLQQGMAAHIAVPPNTVQADCLQPFEQAARTSGLGLWRDRYWNYAPADQLSPKEGGFRVVSGRVQKVEVNSSVWLELKGNLVVRIARQDWLGFGYTKQQWLSLKGQSVAVRGWIQVREARQGRKPLVLQVRTPHALQQL